MPRHAVDLESELMCLASLVVCWSSTYLMACIAIITCCVPMAQMNYDER